MQRVTEIAVMHLEDRPELVDAATRGDRVQDLASNREVSTDALDLISKRAQNGAQLGVRGLVCTRKVGADGPQ